MVRVPPSPPRSKHLSRTVVYRVFGRRSRAFRAALVTAMLSLWLPVSGKELSLGSIRLPDHFTIQVYTSDVPEARSMALGAGGTLFVGTMETGVVYAVEDRDGDGRAERVRVILEGLTEPNGVAVRDGALYVAERSRVLRYDDIEDRLDQPPQPVIVNNSFPRDGHHGWKFIRFGPQGHLFVPVGAPCNICEREDERYAAIHRMKPDGSDLQIFAHGVRNTVGFDWHPGDGALWFTDNGRDWLGDDSPPDELNRAPQAGLHFGYPYCHAGDISDPKFGSKRPCSEFVPPAQRLGPHVAALGMRFYTGKMFPSRYRNQIFIAEHGSWNRPRKIGYRVMLVELDGTRVVSYEPFAEGWLRGQAAWGRPVDVQVMPDGALLVSDDEAGAIYRITYRAPGGDNGASPPN